MAEETSKYVLNNLVVDYNSQAIELQDGNTLTGEHMQNIDAALDSAAKAEKVAEALNELDNTIAATKTSLENQMTSLRGDVNTQIQNGLGAVSVEVNKKADKNTTDTNAKNKYWKFDSNGNLVFVELQMDDKLDVHQGTNKAGKYLKVNNLGYVEASNMDVIVQTLPTTNLDPNINYYLKTSTANGTTYTLYKAINGNLYKVSGDDSRVGELVTEVAELSDTLTVLEPEINKYDLSYDGKVMKFIETNLSSGQVLSTKEFNIISAEETTNTTITITPITKTPIVTTLDSIPNIEFTFANTFSEAAGGADTDDEISVIWRVDNTAVKSEKLKSKQDGAFITHSFAAQEYITKGGMHAVLVTMKDSYGASASFAWKVNAVYLSIDLTLDNSTVWTDDIKFKYIPYGSVSKKVTIQWKPITSTGYNRLATYSNITDSGTQLPTDSYVTLAKSKLAHGAYTIRAYCTATVDEKTITSKIKYVDIMYAENGNITPIISWPDEDTKYKQYTQISHKFAIYNPQAEETSVKLYIKTPEGSSYKLISTTLVKNSVEQIWNYLPLLYGNYFFKIEVGTELVDREKVFAVEKENYQIDIVKDDLAIDFNAQGRSNSDANRLWTSEDNVYKLTVSDDFDWFNGGWVTDMEGATAFCVKAGSRAYLNFSLFRRLIDNGIYDIFPSFKIVFKTQHCKNFYAEAIRCGNETDRSRLSVKAQNAYLYLGGKETRVDYMEDEKLELDYVIDTNKSLATTFINSDPSKLEIIPELITNDQERTIEIGSDDCDVYLYRFKAFTRPIGYGEVLQNYITDTPIGEEMKARYDRCDIWDMTKHTNESFASNSNLQRLKTLFEDINPSSNPITWVDYTKLARKNPELRVILITCPRFTTSKDDKVKGCIVQQIMGNGQDPKHNWIATNVQLQGQGTSSNKYGMSARNLDLKFGDGFTSYVNGVEGNHFDKYSMTDKSIGVNYFNLKVNVASSENANNARIAERYNNYDPYLAERRRALTFLDEATKNKVRDTMEFHPCVIFIMETQKDHEGNIVTDKDGNPVSPIEGPLNIMHFYAAGDFGNSKKNHEVFGMDEDAYDDFLAAGDVLDTKEKVEAALAAQVEGKDEYISVTSTVDGEITETKYYYPNECIVEIADNNNPSQFFMLNSTWKEHNVFDPIPDQDPFGNDVWDEDVEFRYPEVLADTRDNMEEDFKEKGTPINYGLWYLTELAENRLRNKTRRLWQWVTQTDTTATKSQAEINALSTTEKEDYKIFKRDPITGDYLDSSNNKIDAPFGADKAKRVPLTVTYSDTTYAYDSKEYRLAKFKNEFEDYLVASSAFFYYLFTSRYQMIDNRAKNTFLHTADGIHWDLCFDYDNDTALGIDNFGKLTLEYGTEDIDKFETEDEDGNPIITGRFNGYQSTLWCNIRDCFEDELRDLYNELEGSNNDGCWSATRLCNDFESYQNHKPEALQALDMYNKYTRPTTAGHHTIVDDSSIYIPMLNGRKTSQRRRFEKYQERYFGSKYYTTNTYNNAIVIRPTTSGGGNEFALRIKAYSKFYPNWSTSQGSKPAGTRHRITTEGEIYDMVFRASGDLSSTVLNLLGSACYADLGDLSFLTPSTATLNKGEKLSVITLGSPTRKNEVLTTIDLPEGLEELNIDNCLAIQTLRLNGEGGTTPHTQLKKISAQMPLATGVLKGPLQITLPSNGLLEEANLNAVDTLFGENLAKLHTLTVEGRALKNLKLNNCGDWNAINENGLTYNDCLKTIIENSSIGTSISDPGRVRLTNVKLSFDENWSDEELSGVGVRLMDRVLMAKGYNEAGGEINIGSNTLGWGGSYLSGSIHYNELAEGTRDTYNSAWKDATVSAATYIKQYRARFEDENGNLLHQAYYTVINGEATVYEPVTAGRMVTPMKDPDEQYVYTWNRWVDVADPKKELLQNKSVTISENTTFRTVFVSTPRTYEITWDLDNGIAPQTQTLDYDTQLECPFTFNKYQIKDSGTRYDLFRGWDKPLGKVKYNMTIKALWENGDISNLTASSVNPEELNASQIYTIIKTKSKLSEWFQTKDRLTIPVSVYPEYEPIISGDSSDPFYCHNLVSKTEHFFGDKPRIIDTEVALLDKDQDWTLVIDGFMGEQTFSADMSSVITTFTDGTLLSCQSSDAVGLRISMESNKLYVHWYGRQLQINKTDYTRIVLRHPKGSSLYVSYANPSSSINEEHIISTGQVLAPVTSSIILGGIQMASSPGYRNPATGMIKGCKLWKNDIGAVEALKMSNWMNETWKFSIVNAIADDGSLISLYGNSHIDLWSDSIFKEGSAWAIETQTQYPASTIQKLFEKLRDSFPESWLTLLVKQPIKYVNTDHFQENIYNKNGSTQAKDWVIINDPFDYENPEKYISTFETNIYGPALSEIHSIGDIASRDTTAGRNDFLKNKYADSYQGTWEGTSTNPGGREYYKARPYELEGASRQAQFIYGSPSMANTKWQRLHPSHVYGWYYKEFPSTASWDTVRASNTERKWVYAQMVNPLKDTNNENELFDGCVWIPTNNPTGVSSFSSAYTYLNGAWHKKAQEYIWLRTQLAKDFITMSSWFNVLGKNGAFGSGTSQGWIVKSSSGYGAFPCISI